MDPQTALNFSKPANMDPNSINGLVMLNDPNQTLLTQNYLQLPQSNLKMVPNVPENIILTSLKITQSGLSNCPEWLKFPQTTLKALNRVNSKNSQIFKLLPKQPQTHPPSHPTLIFAHTHCGGCGSVVEVRTSQGPSEQD